MLTRVTQLAIHHSRSKQNRLPVSHSLRSYWWGRKATPSAPTPSDSQSHTGGNDKETVVEHNIVDHLADGSEVAIEGTKLGSDFSGSGIETLTSATSTTDVAPLLKYGYYPTDLLRQGVEFSHNSTGLPYWIVVVGGTLAIRSILLPMQLSSGGVPKTKLHSMELELELEPIKREMEAIFESAKTKGDPTDSKLARMKELEAKAQAVRSKRGGGTETPDSSAAQNKLPTVAAFLNISVLATGFFAFRDMGEYCDGWDAGGPAWCTNLNFADTTYLLPVIFGTSLYVATRFSLAEIEDEKMRNSLRKWLLAISAISVPVIGHVTSGLAVFLVTQSSFNAAQTVLLSRPAIRRALSLPPRPPIRP